MMRVCAGYAGRAGEAIGPPLATQYKHQGIFRLHYADGVNTRNQTVHVAIIGAAGMIGRKLAEYIARAGRLGGQAIDTLTLVDVTAPQPLNPSTGTCSTMVMDLSESDAAGKLIAHRPDIIVHLAAIVSSDAEANFDKGYRVNLDGTRALLEAIRAAEEYVPRVIYASSLAVFGAPFPEKIPENYHLTPLTSYGTQKAMGEMLINDYSRRGLINGVGIRFPTICIRPGKPNKAASSFFSGILREPLNGQTAVLPVDESIRHWFASPRSAVGFIDHATSINTTLLGAQRNLTMPGVSATVGEQIDALRNIAGNAAVALIQREPDADIARIVAGWARDFDTTRAHSLGFRAEPSFNEIIKVYLEDEMGQ